MGKHTPGVWKVELMGGTIRAVDIEGNDVGLIADAHNEISRANLREAVNNHNLVPELLTTLKYMVRTFGRSVEIGTLGWITIDNASKIIKKAEAANG